MENLRTKLQKIIDETRASGDWSKVTDEQIAGIILSSWAMWDGFKVFKACAAAAEDANFHTEAAAIDKMAYED